MKKSIFLSFVVLAFSMVTKADPGVRVSCWEGLLLRPWGTPGTYMAFVKTGQNPWAVYQKDMNCSFERPPYQSFVYFNCSNANGAISLEDYDRRCVPAHNPHHQSCSFFPVIKFSNPDGSTKIVEFSSCNFDLGKSPNEKGMLDDMSM